MGVLCSFLYIIAYKRGANGTPLFVQLFVKKGNSDGSRSCMGTDGASNGTDWK